MGDSPVTAKLSPEEKAFEEALLNNGTACAHTAHFVCRQCAREAHRRCVLAARAETWTAAAEYLRYAAVDKPRAPGVSYLLDVAEEFERRALESGK